MKLKELRGLFRLRPGDSTRAMRGRFVDVDVWADFRYKIQRDGKDALFKFGTHKNRTVSQVDKLDPEYLDWILQRDTFPEEIKEIIRYVRRFKQFRGDFQGGGRKFKAKIIDDPILPRRVGKSHELSKMAKAARASGKSVLELKKSMLERRKK